MRKTFYAFKSDKSEPTRISGWHFKLLWLCIYNSDDIFWMRLFGYGFYVKNKDKSTIMLFSERNKLRGITIGKYFIDILKPIK